MHFQITQVSGNDLKNLQEISRRTFSQSFAEMNTQENMQFFLEHHYGDEKLSAELANRNSSFFFAKQDELIIGYLKINLGDAQTVLPNDGGLEIERIYIDQDFKARGIGQLFIQKSLEIAKEFKLHFIWLGVWENNVPAIRFYEKNGFKIYSSHIFKLGGDEQTDLLMRRTMQAGSGSSGTD